jgi:hypothetical protein
MKNCANLKLSLSILLLFLFTISCEDDPIQYQLSTQVSPEGSGSISPISGMYNKGVEVEITAQSNEEYIFKNWTGDAGGNENPMTIIMTEDKLVTAVFERIEYTLNIEIIGEGKVKQEVVLAKSSTYYDSGTMVKLTGEPDEGWIFKGWSGDHSGAENPLTVTIDKAVNIIAIFERDASLWTFIPDDNFETALLDEGFDHGLDDYVLSENIKNIEELNISGRQISNLTGIEDFFSLIILNASDNDLSSIDLSHNTDLLFLLLNDNELINLDISALPVLWDLNALNNSLTCVTVNQEQLDCVNNGCVTNNEFGGWKVDEGVVYSLDCSSASGEQTYVPDDNFEQALIDLGLDDILDDYVSSISIKNTEELWLENRGIQDLTGIEDFENLKILVVTNNNLVNLDVSQNSFLESLICDNNQLTSLDISQNIFLSPASFLATQNQLSCIQISPVQLWGGAWLGPGAFAAALAIDEGATYSVDCSISNEDKTYVPDDQFEQALIDLELDDVMDDYVKTLNIINVIELDVSGKDISDVTGMEDFKGLSHIDISNNNIAILDISEWGVFFNLYVSNNPLTCIQASEAQMASIGGLMLIWYDDGVTISENCD